MNVMQVCSGRGLNGAIYSTILTSLALTERGHRVVMVCEENPWIRKQLAGSSVQVIPSTMRRWPLSEARRIAAIALEEKIDVLHTHKSRAHVFGLLLRWFSGIPCVATAHSCHFQPHWILNDLVIAVSESTRRYQMRANWVRGDRIVTIYNIIDIGRLDELDEDVRAKTRAKLGIADSTYVLTTVGSIMPRKAQHQAVRAMARVVERFPDSQLLVVGKPTSDLSYYEMTRAEAVRLGVEDHIQWLGLRGDVLELLSASDVYLHPAMHEPLGRAVLEAMAVRLPIIASGVDGLREVIVNGQTGALVPPGDSDAMARETIAILEDPVRRKAWGNAARERFDIHTTPQLHGEQTEAALMRAAAMRSPKWRRAA